MLLQELFEGMPELAASPLARCAPWRTAMSSLAAHDSTRVPYRFAQPTRLCAHARLCLMSSKPAAGKAAAKPAAKVVLPAGSKEQKLFRDLAVRISARLI